VRSEIGESKGRTSGDGLSGVRSEEEVAGGRADFADDWKTKNERNVRIELSSEGKAGLTREVDDEIILSLVK